MPEITSVKRICSLFLCVFVLTCRNINTYRFMSDYEYQLGPVDIITEAAPEEEITKECYLNGTDYLSNLTSQQKLRMCKEALTLERFKINNFSLIENGLPGEVKKYKSSFQITHVEGDMLHLISLGFPCPTKPGPVYLQQGVQKELIYVNTLKSVASTPPYEIM